MQSDSSEQEQKAAEVVRLVCPGCAEEVDVAAESAGQLVRCPYCNSDFFASADQAHLDVVDDTAPVQDDRDSRMDQLRIENYSALKMSAIRARSWWLIATVFCSLTVLQLLSKILVYVFFSHCWGVWPTVYLLAAGGVARAALTCRRRARAFGEEIKKSAIPEPTDPPDFGPLNNGRDHWRHLEEVR